MKVKIISAIGNVINLSVNGVPYSYYISRPEPLLAKDAHLILDHYSMLQPLKWVRPWVSPVDKLQEMFKRFVLQLRKRVPVTVEEFLESYGTVELHTTNWIRENAIPLDVEGQSCLVLTPEMLVKMERGEFE